MIFEIFNLIKLFLNEILMKAPCPNMKDENKRYSLGKLN
jgi:hypothetical protein